MVLAKVLDVLLVQQAIILVELVLQTYNKLCDSHLGHKRGARCYRAGLHGSET